MVFLNDWVILYYIPTYLLTDNGPQLLYQYFSTVYAHLSLKKLTSTAYHPHTNSQVKWYNRITVANLDTIVRDIKPTGMKAWSLSHTRTTHRCTSKKARLLSAYFCPDICRVQKRWALLLLLWTTWETFQTLTTFPGDFSANSIFCTN